MLTVVLTRSVRVKKIIRIGFRGFIIFRPGIKKCPIGIDHKQIVFCFRLVASIRVGNTLYREHSGSGQILVKIIAKVWKRSEFTFSIVN